MKKILLLITLLLMPLQRAHAAIYIVIDQFSPEHKFPIAIADFINEKTSATDPTGIEISDTLRRNIKLAGYFDIIDKGRYSDRSASVEIGDVNFSQWTATGAKVFVKGIYKQSGKSITLEMRLYDPTLQTMLVGKRYKVKADKVYAAIHRFADEIMLALTGEKGIFNTKIAAACGPRGKEQIVIMNVDGTERELITNNGTLNLSPAWSPDGGQIAYTSYLKYFPEIYMTNLGKKRKKDQATRMTFNNKLNITPAFSPDGSKIAIASSMAGDPDLHLIDLIDKKIRQITNTFGIDLSPTWSPDGQFIAFASERAGNLHLFVTDENGAEPKRLTFAGYQNDNPAWSPKGDKIAFVRRADGGFNVFMMNADGTGQTQITSGGNNENPAFSPDGRYLVYSSSRSGGSNLYIMMWDGSNQTVITTDKECKTPDWSTWMEEKK